MGDCIAFQGTLLHTPGPQPGAIEILNDHLIIVNTRGRIAHLAPSSSPDSAAALQAHGIDPAAVKVLQPQQFLLPGFIDAHAHAPQYQYCGVGTDLPLIGETGWLATYAFPTERSFGDVQHARHVYSKCVQRLLRLGTTTANYFTTLHVGACKVLADVVQQAGQRAVLGKVCMDQHSPDSYIEQGAAAALQGAQEVVQYIQGLHCSRLMPAVIPRFIPTCSQELLSSLGKLAAQHSLHIHSHISESRDQVAFSKTLHPHCAHDAEVYHRAGLLAPKAVFAHGTQLTDDELRLMAANGAGIAHCPLSNFYFGDGLFDVCKALGLGVKVGLGSDIAGGYSPSMLQAQRMAVINSHALKAAALMYGGQQGGQQGQGQQQQQQGQQQGQQGQEQQQQEQQQQDQQQQQGQEQQQGEQQQEVEQRAGAQQGNSRAGSKVAAAISNPAVSAAAAAHMLTWEDALWLATAGGAAALGLSDRVGCFAVGMEFDALLVDASVPVFDVLQKQDNPLVLLEHFLNNGDDRNITAVYVAGRRCV